MISDIQKNDGFWQSYVLEILIAMIVFFLMKYQHCIYDVNFHAVLIMYQYFRTYVIMPNSEVVNTKSKQCVQVAAEDGKDGVQQQETTCFGLITFSSS